jgi:acetoin utilization deacetylase AcuC-like enzyme
MNAAMAALETPERLAANLAGGTHHALPDSGEGYCTLNDVAIAIRWLQQEGFVRRVLVCDLDVHQGNGTAAIFAGADDVCTFSMHGARNFPLRKPPSTCDVPLEDGTGDDAYLEALRNHLPRLLAAHRPELVFYLAGVDVVEGDRFGRLKLTESGLASRDRFVIETVAGRSTPLCLVLAGGYARTADRTAELHAHAHREARRWLRTRDR